VGLWDKEETLPSLGKYTSVFQVEVYAIKACMIEKPDWNYRIRNIYIVSESQAAIKFFSNHWISSKAIWDYHQSLIQLIERNTVQMIWDIRS
jgi:hypothetical protein